MLEKTSTTLMIVALLVLISVCQLTEASDGQLRIGELQQQQQPDELPQLNSDLNLERAKLESQQQTHQYKQATTNGIFAPKQKRHQAYYNRQDAEPTSKLAAKRLRYQRSPSSQGGSVLLPLFSQYPNNNQQLFDDENAMRRDLPNLIAQARIDKNVERALLKMLINAASLRSSSLTNSIGPYYYNGNADQVGTLDSIDTTNEAPRMSARLEQLIDEPYAGVDPSSVSDSNQPAYLREQEQQYQTVIDKREYIKPCSFNAVSCAKNPFRKYQS